MPSGRRGVRVPSEHLPGRERLQEQHPSLPPKTRTGFARRPTGTGHARPDSIQARLGAIRRLAEAEMKNLRALLGSDAAVVRAELARHIDSITMTPTGEHYVASGSWNLVGRGSIDGAGGPVCTVRPYEFTLSPAA